MSDSTVLKRDAAVGKRAVALYRRVSTDHQDTARQEAGIRDLAEHEFPGAPLVDFADDGVSAFHVAIFERPAGHGMIEAVKRGELQAIVTDTQDRLSRGEQAEWWKLYALCKENGAAILTVEAGGVIGDSIADQMMAALRQAMAHDESARKSHRAKTGIAHLVREGYWRGGPVPPGYRRSDDRILYETDKAPAIREAFERFDQGASVRDVAAFLSERFGRRVDRGSAHYILRNPTYAGFVPEGVTQSHGRKRAVLHEGRHGPKFGRNPIVPRELFESVQARLDDYASADARLSRVNLLEGIGRCGACGQALRYKSVRHPKYELERTYYQCERPTCGEHRVPAEYVEIAVCLALDSTRLALEEHLDDPTWGVTAPNYEAALAAQAELDNIGDEIRRVVRLVAAGTVAEDDATAELEPRYRRKRQLETQRARLSDDGRRLRTDLETLRDALSAALEPFEDASEPYACAISYWLYTPRDERRRFLRQIIERAEVEEGPFETDAFRSPEHGQLLITFRAGISIPVPLRMGRRDRVYSHALRHVLGFGRKVDPASQITRPATQAPGSRKDDLPR